MSAKDLKSPFDVLAFLKDNPGPLESRFKNYLILENYIEEVDEDFLQLTKEGMGILKEFGEEENA